MPDRAPGVYTIGVLLGKKVINLQQHIIVDGYNFILRTGKIDPADDEALWKAREKLIHQLIAFRGNKKLQITIVFDGQDVKLLGKTPRPSGIQVLFSRAPQKADPLILKLIDQSQRRKSITLVTSDRFLASSARGKGSQTLSVEDFQVKIGKRTATLDYKNKYEQTMSQTELEEWLRLFGGETNVDKPKKGNKN